MSLSETKQRIIAEAIIYFNEVGFMQASMRGLGEKMQISPGNLAYHFKNKEVLLHFIYDQMYEEMKEALRPNSMASMETFQQMLSFLYHFQQRYLFFFLDLAQIVKTYPEIEKRHSRVIKNAIDQGRMLLDFYVGRGLIIPEPEEGIFDRIVHTAWLINTFWTSQKRLLHNCGVVIDKQFTFNMIWNLVLPYLTDKGRAQYEILIHKIDVPQPKKHTS